MNNQEYEQKKRECWEEYCQTHPLCNTPVMRLNFDWTFDRAYALGKREKDAEEIMISGWVARDSDGTLTLFEVKPERVRYIRSNKGLWMAKYMTDLISELFPDLTWESDPEPIEIIIKRKKNG